MKRNEQYAKRYDVQTKQKCLSLFLNGDLSRVEAIQCYGLGKTTLWNWTRDYCKKNHLDFPEVYLEAMAQYEKESVTHKQIVETYLSNPGTTQRDVARRLGVGNATVSRAIREYRTESERRTNNSFSEETFEDIASGCQIQVNESGYCLYTR